MRRWWNWQTRRSQKPVPQGVRVQLPPSAFSRKMKIETYIEELRTKGQEDCVDITETVQKGDVSIFPML